jgi:hypothetical protein
MDLEVLLRRIPPPLGIGRGASRRLALHFIKSLNVPLTQVGGCTLLFRVLCLGFSFRV